ncbi:hypothetical protein SDRG_01253 [Saprolegnia diclina VS20]|uniref:Uncharacterized protein n=1 Tax=Saprolegnia diclina (strain VS20) TaxID=1156394 RepID=T0S7W9_SAPDV|nr:hypothetical protein SDRG_01253 [Saprolegnia diclina VS20]EQC41278.1 hypothetical protein SDRG_01253 [Saprolegnia diclina VS20]|eukprot:XP_008604992.1 hypothetical protein SDRG_01253 [Saprolegnia diclina VS20]
MAKGVRALYAAAATGTPSDDKTAAFADACVALAKSQAASDGLAQLLLPAATFKGKDVPANKLALLQLQVLCRLALQAVAKEDPWSKVQKKELVSLLSLLAMTMDAASMQSSSHEQLHHEHSAFSWFVLDTIASRFQRLVPKTIKRLLKELEIEATESKPAPALKLPLTLPKELVKEPMTRQSSNDYVIAAVLSQEATSHTAATNPLPVQQLGSFKEFLLPTVKPLVKSTLLNRSTSLPVPRSQSEFDSPRAANEPPPPAKLQPMVMKTPDRPQRPAAKKRLVLVASSPPLRRPVKRNISALSLLKKPDQP